ncbi:MAG: B12-binding domain-containing radical SAM protein [Oscillospiraceae bacterium]|nr:B12-binding domain-containing radical SAM protein [Oscillospiraceae bacterium]
MNYLFIYPDFLDATKHVKTIPGNYNEGIASISAVLKQGGHSVCLYHLTYLPEKDEFIRKVKEFSPGMIGFTIRTSVFDYAAAMAGWLDDELPEIYVMAGGYHPSLAPEEVIATRGIDAVCIGEGEFACRDFVDYYEKNACPDKAAQSFWVKDADGAVFRNPIRPFLTDLDALPFPDLDLFDYTNLKSNLTQNTAEVIVSRGCLYSCTYCANAQLRKIYPEHRAYARFRSPENAIQLLERVLERDPSITAFSFNDAILNMYADWFYPFIELYKQRIRRKYTCNLRFDHIDEKMARTLAESGCYLITIGVENGNEEFRKKYLRRVMKNEHIVTLSHLLKKVGILVYAYNIIGLPHETLALTLETIKLNARMYADNVVASLFFPYPTTELRKISEEGGFLDPSVSMHDPVQLRMKNYPRRDILYMRYSFMPLLKKYRKLYAMTDEAARDKKIARLDRRVLSKHRPRGLIGAWRKRTHLFVVFLKRIASKKLPALYKKLRGMRIKKQAASKT